VRTGCLTRSSQPRFITAGDGDLAPASTNVFAIARPIPLDPPVDGRTILKNSRIAIAETSRRPSCWRMVEIHAPGAEMSYGNAGAMLA